MTLKMLRIATMILSTACATSLFAQAPANQFRNPPTSAGNNSEQVREAAPQNYSPGVRTANQPRGPLGPTQPGVQGRPDIRPIAANGSAPPAAERVIPCPFAPLSVEQQQHLDQLLNAWEQHSAKIERYRCEFERWEYDPIFGPADAKLPKTYASGKLRYGAPDKGLFKVESVKVYTPPAKAGAAPIWVAKKDDIGGHWVCDGKRIFEFDERKKQLIERTLPPEMHGKAIVDGPLPFLFGAKAQKIKDRYWLQEITPSDVKGEYWLEAAPKFRDDAQNFKKVHVIIDEQDFLPKAIQLFDPAFDEQKRPIRTVFTFNKREVNWSLTLEKVRFWEAEFFEPRTPLGWKKVVEPFAPPPASSPPAEQPAARIAPPNEGAPTAQRPGIGVKPYQQR